jgi:hypothetical protein
MNDEIIERCERMEIGINGSKDLGGCNSLAERNGKLRKDTQPAAQ